MPQPADNWASSQLTEFLAAVSAFERTGEALTGAVERVAMGLESEVAAVIIDSEVVASVGFPPGRSPERALLGLIRNPGRLAELPGLGRCESISAALEGGEADGSIVVARLGGPPFSRAEGDLLRGLGRILSLALRTVGLLERERSLRERTEHQADELRERQTLLERLSRLQRSIASRSSSLGDVLDAIVAGAAELIGDPVVGLRVADPHDPGRLELVSVVGVDERTLERIRFSAVGQGAGGQAFARGELVVVEGYRASPNMIRELAGAGLEAAMAAPIFERGEPAGSLVVASREPGRTYEPAEQEMLMAFAEHAGLALNDARVAAETRHQAFHDPLTDLPNRALFLERLQAAIEEGAQKGSPGVAVLFADLDGFKTINDSLGHQAGDKLLVQVSARLRAALRSIDFVARFGGDEFAVLVRDVDGIETADLVAGRVLELLREPFAVGGREVYVSASIGVAAGCNEPDDLMRNADLAMYEAKSRGKGRIEVFDPAMHEAALRRLDCEVGLKAAIERQQLVLHYQPVCRLSDGAVLGAEGLVRWQHPERGLVPPLEFIPIAEESGQIVAIGNWVLREACRAGAAWRADHPELDFRVGVNISGVQLERSALVEEVASTLAVSGLEPQALVIEITESALMTDVEHNVERLARLKQLGVSIAVDDFGTGYSSLEFIRRFPLDLMKMAKPFVDELGSGGQGAAIASTIMSLAGGLGLEVVAEGIELERQRDALIGLDCTMGQGFLFSRPVEREAIGAMLRGPSAPVELSV